jgi:hypothetical protein
MVRPKKSKLRGSQWSFYQLRQLILYKTALSGIVFEVTSAYTSQGVPDAINGRNRRGSNSPVNSVDTMTTETLPRHSRLPKG